MTSLQSGKATMMQECRQPSNRPCSNAPSWHATRIARCMNIASHTKKSCAADIERACQHSHLMKMQAQPCYIETLTNACPARFQSLAGCCCASSVLLICMLHALCLCRAIVASRLGISAGRSCQLAHQICLTAMPGSLIIGLALSCCSG